MSVPGQEYDSCYPFDWCVWAFDFAIWLGNFCYKNFLGVTFFCDFTSYKLFDFQELAAPTQTL